ncbi:MAG: hypothetical protein DRQ62_00510 [Gammaproteobacteria bacterium]|nr:MAG: hypothetical protein DRQ62_00510 [Gammaproteobacteria bacterium]
MKKNNVQKGIFAALLLASPFVTAGTQYPASDFQPKVVYQDKDYQHEGSTSSSSSASASTGKKAAADANYPAATFEPKVVYQDKDYKHSSGAASSKSIPLAMWEEKVDAAIEEKYAEEAGAEGSSMNPLFAVLVLAIAGFLYFKNSKGTTAQPKAGARARRVAAPAANFRNAEGVSGVAKYLQNKIPKLSGVDKYLQANQSAPKSGVAKYVAKKVVAAKQAASEKTTGVEKYVRKKG